MQELKTYKQTWVFENGVDLCGEVFTTYEGNEIMKFTFKTFEECEKYFFNIFDTLQTIPVSTKVIGKKIFIFKKNLAYIKY